METLLPLWNWFWIMQKQEVRFTAPVQTCKTHLLVSQTLTPMRFKLLLSWASAQSPVGGSTAFGFSYSFFLSLQNSSEKSPPIIIVAQVLGFSVRAWHDHAPLLALFGPGKVLLTSAPLCFLASILEFSQVADQAHSPVVNSRLCRHMLNSSAHFLACPGSGPSTTDSHVTRATYHLMSLRRGYPTTFLFFSFYKWLYYFPCLGVLPASMSVHHIHVAP